MSQPSRSRSLRQPGFAHRDLTDGAQRTTNVAKNRESNREWRPSEDAKTGPGEHPQTNLAKITSENESGSGQRQELSSSQRTNGTSARSQKRHLNDRQNSIRRGEDGNPSAIAPAGGYKISSALPLPRLLSRSSSIRQPAGSVGSSIAVKSLHSRHASVEGASTDGSGLLPVSTPARLQAQAECGLHSHSIPLPSCVSTASRPVVGHNRSRSNGTVLERGSEKYYVADQESLSLLEKPQFSTYQQKFSPQKQKPSNEPTKVAQSPSYKTTEVTYLAALQGELLQLQWVYISSHKTLQNWTESGERRISEQRKKHIKEAWKLKELEQKQQNCIDGVVLRDWLDMDKGKTSFEKVETLSRCIQTLTNLSQPHAKLCRAVEEFEAWHQDTIDTLSERSGHCEWASPQCLQPLPQPWAENVTMLILSLGTCLRYLEELRSSDGSSGLGLVLDAHRRLTVGMLEELTTIKSIQRMVLEQEDDWIKGRMSALLLTTSETSASSPCGNTRSAAWHRVP